MGFSDETIERAILYTNVRNPEAILYYLINDPQEGLEHKYVPEDTQEDQTKCKVCEERHSNYKLDMKGKVNPKMK